MFSWIRRQGCTVLRSQGPSEFASFFLTVRDHLHQKRSRNDTTCGVVRIRQPSGGNMLSEPFNIDRGALLADILSRVCFYAGLDKTIRVHGVVNSRIVVGEVESAILISKFEYADDAALVVENTVLASTRVTALATGSMTDAAMLICIKKSKGMHIHRPIRMDATTEADVATLGLSHKCDSCGRDFIKQIALRVDIALCDGGRT